MNFLFVILAVREITHIKIMFKTRIIW